ncbi:MAG: hypothetical protein H2212_12795 [Ruminococcus sp.]|nr:hypothetical protein [Ruminococcus sp.]
MQTKEKRESLIEEIWKRSGLDYVSDMVYITNCYTVLYAVKQLPARSYSEEQWERLYEYLFCESGEGKHKADILEVLLLFSDFRYHLGRWGR